MRFFTNLKILGLTLVLLATFQVNATVVSFDLNTEFSGGDAPLGPAPWFNLTFDDAGSTGSVSLTMTTYFVDEEFVGSVYFNLDPIPGDLSIDYDSGVFAASIDLGVNAYKADGVGGFYDLLFAYDANAFGRTDTSSWIFTGTGLTADSFNFLSLAGPGDPGQYYAAAHIQSIGTGGDGSGWIGTSAVPVPAAVWLFGSGLIGLVGVARRRKA